MDSVSLGLCFRELSVREEGLVDWGLGGVMALRKFVPSGDAPPSVRMKPLNFTIKMNERTRFADAETSLAAEPDVDIDLREVYFLIMHFLSAGPCRRTYGQFWNELLEHQLLPRRYHAWYSRNGMPSGDENDDGNSFPLSYNMLVERYSHIQKDHLIKLLKQLILSSAPPSRGISGGNAPNAADRHSFYPDDRDKVNNELMHPPAYMRWPHMKADQVRGLSLREIGGGFPKHHRAPSIRAACYAVAKPSTMVQKMQNIKMLRGHRNAVYCAIFDRSGRYVITGADDRLVKIWSMETAYCLASCRGHEGDITDLAVSSNNAVVASSSNDCNIRVWRLPDGLPVSVLRGHTGAVTAIAFSPRPGFIFQLLSSSDDGTCRLWDARSSQLSPRIYVPRPSDSVAGKNNGPSSSVGAQNHQIFCCTFNANGTVFVTGSSDTLARVWNASKQTSDESDQPNHEIDVLSGHENDVNYVQFSGCAVASRFMTTDNLKEENVPKFKNSWFTHENIVTCSRDGSAIIWIPRSRRSHGKAGRWTRAYHLKVPPPPMPPQPVRGGPRQRMLPTPRGVNMIIWSLDNRFVLAAIMGSYFVLILHYVKMQVSGNVLQTYVLDVHPFNPRIAMSAGYDGRTIVWDIWEGKPIRTYEISRFKLVDGKFSPDGTSIILSDDVGQLYILNTGQGESQEDAKYDQFFLGDYRPLIQDTHGNVLDQSNVLDLSIFSSTIYALKPLGMIPYPEPYQSAYQKRRLGALGLEWNPNSLKLATGPDFTLDPEYQMLPLADLDMLTEPLPEFVDVMDWEPEVEMQSDDTDSDFNVNEDYLTGGEQGSLSSNSSDDPEGSAEDGETDDTQLERLRRSKRKKQKAEIEIMTSSGRRVKRRNFDEGDGNPLRINKTKKSKSGRKASRKKSSKSKSLRPRRAAAKNALNLFSKITGTFTDGEDEDGSGVDTSESESTLQDSDIESDGSDKYLQNEQSKQLKGKEISLDNSDLVNRHKAPEYHINGGNRARLVLKLPLRESNKLVARQSIVSKCMNQADLVSSRVPQEAIERNGNCVNSQDPRYSPGDYEKLNTVEGPEGVQLDKADYLNLTEDYKNGKIRWGGVRARSSKRLRSGEAAASNSFSRTSLSLQGHHEKQNYFSGCVRTGSDSVSEFPDLQIHKHEVNVDGMAITDGKDVRDGTSSRANGVDNLSLNYDKTSKADDMTANNGNMADLPPEDSDKASKSHDMSASEATSSSLDSGNGDDLPPGQTNNCPSLISTKFRLKRISRDSENPCEQRVRSSVGNLEYERYTLLHDKPLDTEQDPAVPENEMANRMKSEHRYGDLLESDTQCDKNATCNIKDSVESHHLHGKKMYTAVYRRAKSHKGTTTLEGFGGGKEGSTSNASNHNLSVGVDIREDSIDGSRGTQSTGLEASTSPNVEADNVKVAQGLESGYMLRNTQNSSMSRRQLPQEEWGSSSRMTVGLRSTRNRRGSHHLCETSPIDTTRKSSKSSRKGTWLMLTTHEEGSRYIPQLGDEVAYLRQGHQEYLEHLRQREHPPWISVKGNLRDVEFCKVQDLEYSSFAGSGESCCKMTLQFVDPSSDVYGRSFKMTLPEMTGFPDFLVERTRYDAAIQRNWTHRDKCQVWWKNDGEEDGSWWLGRILSVKAKSDDFPESPWERYTVQYKGDPPETHLHSPWELLDISAVWEQPHIDDDSKDGLQSAFAKLERSSRPPQDRFGINKLKQLSQRPNFANRFPVPLSLEVIQSRLENNYYRSLEAVKHDFKIMLSNAENFVGSKSDFSLKLKRLSDWFAKTLSSL
ncbi:Guanine nucleotide-binding protein, beta subunit [Parasponia andersonii]|uniref:Guanine nucleotide-binding protein, beta subunit n=1 Tax=Parasponia andersonii TaxID=3476 RepID=A0A2P5CLK4_PARAD|nr:Guanine nucleotide-binding protein, beta subunit [Parasponia andersonii]